MKVRDLLAILNDLNVGDLDKEVYIDVEGDEYKDMEFCPIAEAIANNEVEEVIGFVISEAKSDTETKLPFDGVH